LVPNDARIDFHNAHAKAWVVDVYIVVGNGNGNQSSSFSAMKRRYAQSRADLDVA
jgi:hypothetical protein